MFILNMVKEIAQPKESSLIFCTSIPSFKELSFGKYRSIDRFIPRSIPWSISRTVFWDKLIPYPRDSTHNLLPSFILAFLRP